MFFIASKLLIPLTSPFSYVVVLLLAAFVLSRRVKVCKYCLLSALVLLFIFGTAPLQNMLHYILESRYPHTGSLAQVDAIVVLSGMLSLEESKPGELEFGGAVDRILTAISLIKKGVGKHLILSGGSGDLYDQSKSEALLLKDFALKWGVPEDKLLVEATSRNTYENVLYTKAVMEEHGISNVLVVTTASHLPRVMGCFAKLGVEAIPYGVDRHSKKPALPRLAELIPSPENFLRSSQAIHEYIGIVMYKISGYL
ncbi:hypothetical protein CSB45_06770 [candidate division KSB3 bacterium]|uniref:DUF218 domain-containing protein n=1 Tax=candidate division KSB3 bacterium TaxID=2044937 RepID=A0A2G6E629_9BACT|nr:MAG: hypothetical protein CSB45_06770 [candidate division KSB3 bacterium]PIE30062.1 MAG: hypothetical protein CSA57_05825 [candidate division KSB3 bacterium]